MLVAGIRRTFPAAESVMELVKDLDADIASGPGAASETFAHARDLTHQPPVIRFVHLLIREAHEARASDIHLEATPRGAARAFSRGRRSGRAPEPAQEPRRL